MRSLQGFQGLGYDKGRPKWMQVLWFATMNVVFLKWWCPPRARPTLLRLFGAKVGKDVLIRHRVRVHWPWKLEIGDHSWVGEDAWLLNLEPITIASDVCISQGAFLVTGSHDWRSPTFEYDNGRIVVEQGAWIAARAAVLRGVTVGREATVAAGATARRDVPERALVSA
jgi:putative colanic acid biosynthesis acetyltransferase WcaF